MSNLAELEGKLQIVESQEQTVVREEEPSTSGMSGDRPQKRAGRRPGRRSSKMDVRAKLERSRQSARECRARKKLRYQYLEDLVANREKAVFALREELEMYKQWCIQIDSGLFPLASLAIDENAQRSDETYVQPKKPRLDCDSEHYDVPDISRRTTHVQMDTEDSYPASYETNGTTMPFKGSNSDSSDFSKGANSVKSGEILSGATGSVTDTCSWTLKVDDGIIRIEPRTKDSIFKGANFSLPTIVEEPDQMDSSNFDENEKMISEQYRAVNFDKNLLCNYHTDKYKIAVGENGQLKTLCKEVDEGQPSEQLKEKLFRDCDLEKSELDD